MGFNSGFKGLSGTEAEATWQKAAVDLFDILSKNLFGGNDENHKNYHYNKAKSRNMI